MNQMPVHLDCNPSSRSQLPACFFDDLVDSIIVDIASEWHRIARLDLDRGLEGEDEEMRLSEVALARVANPSSSGVGESGGKYLMDIFGQTHPAVADEIFDCMNCGRPIMAGRFAPHLEKCMGKGRKARVRARRSSTITRSRHSRGSPVSVYAPYSHSTSSNRAPNGTAGVGDDFADFEDP